MAAYFPLRTLDFNVLQFVYEYAEKSNTIPKRASNQQLALLYRYKTAQSNRRCPAWKVEKATVSRLPNDGLGHGTSP